MPASAAPVRRTPVARGAPRNVEWLRPWEATLPPEAETDGDAIPTFGMMVRRLRREAREAPHAPVGADLPGPPRRPGDRRRHRLGLPAGRPTSGTGSTARRPGSASCRRRSRWRSTTASTRCGCTASRSTSGPRTPPRCASSRSSGFRLEGERQQYLHIDGAWRDHLTYVVYAGDVPGGVLAALPARPRADCRVATRRNSGSSHPSRCLTKRLTLRP